MYKIVILCRGEKINRLEIIGREGLNNGKLIEMGMADNHAQNTFHKNNVSA